jgi:threonine/homoserine/homoserine lactone efflux protein
MPLDPQLLLAYLAACVVLILVPGPDMLFVLGQTLAGGARRGWAATAGVYLGVAGHIALAAGGVAALFAASPLLFEAVRIAGAAYLLWLGISALRGALRARGSGGGDAIPPEASAAAAGLRAAFWQGVLTNLLNPKVALFFVAFLPQFVAPGRAPAWLQVLLLGPILPLLALPFYAVLIALAGRLVRGLASARRWLDGTAGAIFLALGLRLLLSAR